jgi:hypothetical protein
MTCQASARAPFKACLQYAALTLALAAAAIPGCNTQVGKEPNPAPQVVITPIGYTPVSGSTTPTITVRSGADVVLSGKDSSGNGVALKTFTWSQTGGQALPALPDPGALLYRNANTVSFRAPHVSSPTSLTLQLTITNAQDASGSGTITVMVEPANDPSQFLIPSVLDVTAPPRRFQVSVYTVEGLSGLPADAPVCVNIGRSLTYSSRDGTVYGAQNPLQLPALSALQAQSSWLKAAGGAANAPMSFSNPRVVFDIPTFNDEELFALFNQPSENAYFGQQLVAADVDKATLLLSINAKPAACDGTPTTSLANRTLAVAVLDSAGSVVLQAQAPGINMPVSLSGYSSPSQPLTSDALLQLVAGSGAFVETRSTADAYYAAIDPSNAKTSLSNWLTANCFNATAPDFGISAAGANGAHAVYTNNFDLGFGRDMYFMRCPITADPDRAASVVINYPSLESAVLKLEPIIAVAMEYSRDAHGNGPFTKFYVFAPDDRTGTFQRVASANFDRRGQKYVPGTCVSCHGGTLNQANISSGNVDAAFMPWDSGSLLFSDTDPAFLGNLVSPSAYTSAAQADSIRRLNAMAWNTYQHPEGILSNGLGPCPTIGVGGCVNRFDAPIALLTKWYGGDPGSANATAYSDTGTPTAWFSAGQTQPASNDLYHQVFAHYCRACHTQSPSTQFTDYASFIAEFKPTGLGLNAVFHDARMPLARLTADRFWVNYSGGDPAALALAKEVQQVENISGLLDANNNVIPPGAPVISPTFLAAGNSALPDASGNITLSGPTGFSGPVQLDGSSSLFVSAYSWTLCTPPGASCAPEPIVGSTDASPAFAIMAPGTYLLTSGTTPSQTYNVIVSPVLPTLTGNCQNTPQSPAPAAAGQTVTTPPCFTPGYELNGTPNTFQVQDPQSLAWCPSTTAPTCTNVGTSAWSATTSSQSIVFGFTTSASANQVVTLNYRIIDSVNDLVASQMSFGLTDVLTAAPDQLTIGWTSATPYQISASTLTANDSIVPPSDTAVTLVVPTTPTTNPPGGTQFPLGGSIGSLPVSIGLTGSFAYTPPAGTFPWTGAGQISTFLTCDINGNDIATGTSPCGGDSFWYYLRSGDGKSTSNTVQVTVKIQATTTFARGSSTNNVYSMLQLCSSCHTGTSTTTTDAAYHWSYSNSSTDTYNCLTNNPAKPSGCNNAGVNWTVSTPTGGAATTPSQTAPYVNVCDSTSSHYMTQYHLPMAAQCTTLQTWIAEGAHDD